MDMSATDDVKGIKSWIASVLRERFDGERDRARRSRRVGRVSPQKDFAEKVGCSESKITDFLQKEVASDRFWAKMLDVLNVTIEQALKEARSRPMDPSFAALRERARDVAKAGKLTLPDVAYDFVAHAAMRADAEGDPWTDVQFGMELGMLRGMTPEGIRKVMSDSDMVEGATKWGRHARRGSSTFPAARK